MSDQILQSSRRDTADCMQASPISINFRVPAAQRQNHALEAARQGLGDHFKSEVESVDILEVHQRPNSRILDCNIHHANGQQHRVMIKIFEAIGAGTRKSLEKLIADDFALTLKLHNHFKSNHRFQVPVPLFHSPRDLVTVTAHMPGTQLQQKLIAQAGWFPNQDTVRDLELNCRSCGEWLTEFQTATLDINSENLELERIRDMIAMRLEWLIDDKNIPVNEAKRDLLLAHFDREVSTLKPADLAVSSVHGDFFPGNVLVDGDHVVGLDFASSRTGSTCADPSYFMFQLETLTYKPEFRKRLVRKLQRAFLQGYNPSIPAENYFVSSPIVRIHFILHNIMRLAGMTTDKANTSWKRKLHNRGVAIAVTRRLLKIASAY